MVLNYIFYRRIHRSTTGQQRIAAKGNGGLCRTETYFEQPQSVKTGVCVWGLATMLSSFLTVSLWLRVCLVCLSVSVFVSVPVCLCDCVSGHHVEQLDCVLPTSHPPTANCSLWPVWFLHCFGQWDFWPVWFSHCSGCSDLYTILSVLIFTVFLPVWF